MMSCCPIQGLIIVQHVISPFLVRRVKMASSRVYVGDLGSGGSKPELEREFERYGPLKSVWVARNPPGMCITQRAIFDSRSCFNWYLILGDGKKRKKKRTYLAHFEIGLVQ